MFKIFNASGHKNKPQIRYNHNLNEPICIIKFQNKQNPNSLCVKSIVQ